MEILKDLEQRTEEWHQERWASLGGTGAKSLMNTKPIESLPIFAEILSESIEEFCPPFDSFMNDAMQRGVDMEPQAFEVYSEQSGVNFKTVGLVRASKYSHASPDGLAKTRKYGFEVAELKCPSAKVHMQYVIDGGIPKDYLPQIINYFAQSEEVGRVHFVSYRPENTTTPIFAVVVNRGDEVEMTIDRKKVKQSFGSFADAYVGRVKELEEKIEEYHNKTKGLPL